MKVNISASVRPRKYLCNGRDTRPGFVYGLYHPKSGELRYIGKTGISVQERFGHHRRDAIGQNSPMPVHRWWRKLQREGLEPTVKTLAECLPGTIDAIESEMIAAHRRKGARLLNIESGGEGGLWKAERRAMHSAECAQRNRQLANDPAWQAAELRGRAKRLGISVDDYLARKEAEETQRTWNRLVNRYHMALSASRKAKQQAKATGRQIIIEGDIARVPLTQGQHAIIDAADAPLVSHWKWSAQKHNGVYRAKRTINGDKGRIELLQWRIVDKKPGQTIRTINGNALDCRRANLIRI